MGLLDYGFDAIAQETAATAAPHRALNGELYKAKTQKGGATCGVAPPCANESKSGRGSY